MHEEPEDPIVANTRAARALIEAASRAASSDDEEEKQRPEPDLDHPIGIDPYEEAMLPSSARAIVDGLYAIARELRGLRRALQWTDALDGAVSDDEDES